MKITLCILVALLVTSVRAQWDTLKTINYMGCLEEIEFPNSNDGYIVANGLIAYTHDAGVNWTEEISPSGLFKAIDFINSDTALVCCYPEDGQDVMITYDGGETWYFPELSISSQIDDAEFLLNGNVILAIGSDFSSESTADVVENYYTDYTESYLLSPVTIPPYDVDFVSNELGFVCGRFLGSTVFKSIDGGYTWYTNDAMEGPVYELSFPSETVGYGIGDESRVWKTIDSGESWQMIDYDFGGYDVIDDYLTLENIYFYNDTIGYLEVDSYDEDLNLQLDIYRTINGGESWYKTKITLEEFQGVNSFWCTSIDTCYAVGCIEIYRTINGGGFDSVDVDVIETANSNNIILSPNPATDYITLSISKNTPIEHVYSYNLYGQKVNVEFEAAGFADISSLNPGVYFTVISTSTGSQVRKWVKK